MWQTAAAARLLLPLGVSPGPALELQVLQVLVPGSWRGG